MSGMTGEAMSVERHSCLSTAKETALNHENMCLMVCNHLAVLSLSESAFKRRQSQPSPGMHVQCTLAT